MLRTVVSLILTVVIAFWVGWFSHALVGDIYFGAIETVEGDTIQVGRRQFEFLDADAPTVATPEGIEARDYLKFVVSDRFVWCRHTGDFSDGRYVGHCYARFEDLSRRMVTEGFARDCNGEYAALERGARELRRGLWADGRMPPSDRGCGTEDPAPDADDIADTLGEEDGGAEPMDAPFEPDAPTDDAAAEDAPTEDAGGDEMSAEETADDGTALDDPVPFGDDMIESTDVESAEDATLLPPDGR